MYGRRLLILGMWLLAAAGLADGAAAKERTWTDNRGRTIRGEFVRELGDEVALLVDGKLVTIPLDRLSPRDREAVRELAAGREVADDLPPTPAPVAEPAAPRVPAPPPSVPEAEADVTPLPTATPPAAAPEVAPSKRSPAPSLTPGRRPKSQANRTWTDAQGRQVSGKFVRVFNGKVMISRPGGIVPVGFYDLSDADQEYVKDVLIERGEESLIPPRPAPQGDGGVGGEAAHGGEAVGDFRAGAMEIAPTFPEYQPVPPAPSAPPAGASEYGAAAGGYAPSGYESGRMNIAPPMPSVPAYDPRGMPSMPEIPQYGTSSSPLRGETERVGVCSGCNREVRGVATSANKCPHCGTRWSYNEFHDGERAGKLADRLGGAAVAAVAALVVAAVMLAGVIGIVMAIAKASRGGEPYKHPRYGPPRY